MKKLVLLIPVFLLSACGMADVDKAATRMPPQRVITKADMLRMEQLNDGVKPPIIYQTTAKQPSPSTPF